ncbi:MAG: 4Fe-4S dicluster domain-containing protein [candidate division Zixibacteria bacterium]|nr:4Fe-4S dicluster domain-containing protein [candidate division Zixibacteria bacterium]
MPGNDSHHRSATFESERLQSLLDAVQSRGYEILGPRVRDNTIVLDRLSSITELPTGAGAEQNNARFRMTSRPDQAFFSFTVGAQSWKNYLHEPTLRLWSARRDQNGFQIDANQSLPRKQAFVGVRPCELNAILALDRVLLHGVSADSAYRSRRENTLIVAVDCGVAGGTCFCTSMGTGPRASSGYDLALTEIIEGDRHYFAARAESELGAEILDGIPHSVPTEAERAAAENVVARAAGQMGRSVNTTSIRDLLVRNPSHPRWDQVATRCMTCGNCTMVCPTCFCTTITDVTDLTGEHAEHRRLWDSCFTLDYSYIHGGAVRSSAKSRFRQWLTHKFGTWFDQFGQSGCVGCGRCITWCPAGIDVTEELAALREGNPPGTSPPIGKETPRGIA